MINVQAFLCLAMVLTQAAGKKGDPLVSVEELRELLKESVQNTISLTALAEQQTQKMEKVMNALEQAETKVANMEKKLAHFMNQTEKDMEMLEVENEETLTEIETLQGEFTSMKEETAKQATSLEGLDERMGNLEVTWPSASGSYCILANGDCPHGFTRFEGYIRAFYTANDKIGYLKPAHFGDSHIQCHGVPGSYGTCGLRSDHWLADMKIVSCCK